MTKHTPSVWAGSIPARGTFPNVPRGLITMKCEYDSGSMYDCRSVCGQRATHTVTYRNGSYGPFSVKVCPQHVRPMEGRAYPGHIATTQEG